MYHGHLNAYRTIERHKSKEARMRLFFTGNYIGI